MWNQIGSFQPQRPDLEKRYFDMQERKPYQERIQDGYKGSRMERQRIRIAPGIAFLVIIYLEFPLNGIFQEKNI